MLKTKPIRKTKKLESLFRRYQVELRKYVSTVVHATTKREVELDPVAFAVFETAIKSVYLANALHERNDSTDGWYGHLANANGFVLPDPVSVPLRNVTRRSMQAGDDYYYCVSILSKSGLSYALLD